MPKVKITNSKGLVQEKGSGVEFAESPVYGVTSLTANTTVTAGGVYTFNSTSPLTATLPKAADVPGSVWTFRSLTSPVHSLTGSDVDGRSIFCAAGFPTREGSGSVVDRRGDGGQLKLTGTVGAAVTLICDGRQYQVLASSGTLTFVNTAAN
ncbi:hypothetical protein CMI47_06900 [Candidatus Pacearchaeota archaeon]|nr:hypothetical protein [Candidatus Pacearchaeota archaeon]|tara:strand:+ start:385 stop:840 length:456 start_codon:yes stop_codon:yes gene_type:complete